MKEFQHRKRVRNILYSPIILLILAILFVLLFRGTVGVYKKEKMSSQNLEKEKIELLKLIEREKNIASSQEFLKTEEGIENEIRTKFRVVKEGEKVSVIINDDASVTPQTSTTTHSIFYKLFHWF